MSVTDPRGGVTKFTYDKVNNLRSLEDPQQNLTEFFYNNWDLLSQERNELLASRFYAYDNLSGDLKRVTDRNGRVTEYGYDNQHRLTTEVWKDAGGTILNTITSTYDAGDQLTSIADAASAYGYTLDGLGRATTVTNSGTAGSPTVVLTQVFDQRSRRTELSATIDGTADFWNIYGWDALSRMTVVQQTNSLGAVGVSPKTASFSYNSIGQIVAINRNASTNGTQLVASSAYDYEAGTQRLIGLKHSTTMGGIGDLAKYTWSYDTLGRVRTFFSANDSGDTASYGYDGTDQLTTVTHSVLTTANENYGYDLAGNRTDGQYNTPANSNNRLQSDGRFQYGYDNEGNLTSRQRLATNTDHNDPYKTLYTWDHRNRLIAVEFWDSETHRATRVAYAYDVFDRRIGKKVDSDANGFFDRSERYVYDEGRDLLFAFLDQDGDGSALQSSLKTRYFNGAHVDQVMAEEWIDGTPGEAQDVYWPLEDNLGSNRDVVRRVNGATQSVEHLRFDSFGKIVADNNPGYSQRQTYAGLEFDSDTGLYYAHHRWYDPITHRFISEDPAGFAGGDANLSRYAWNDSANAVDPSGLASSGLLSEMGNDLSMIAQGAVRQTASMFFPPAGQALSVYDRHQLFQGSMQQSQALMQQGHGAASAIAITELNGIGEGIGVGDVGSALSGKNRAGSDIGILGRIYRGGVGLTKLVATVAGGRIAAGVAARLPAGVRPPTSRPNGCPSNIVPAELVPEHVAPARSPGYWWPGRYTTPASQHGAYVASEGRVFPTTRNSGLQGDALRAAQEAFTRVRLLEGHPIQVVRGQARQAGLTVHGNNARIAQQGAENAVQRALEWYNSRSSNAR